MQSLYRITPQYFIDTSEIEQQLHHVYMNAFSTIYHDSWVEVKPLILRNFPMYLAKFKQEQGWLLVAAEVNDVMAGWALFYINKNDKQAVLEILCIDPAYWRQGLGKKLTFAVRDYYADVTKISLVTSRFNTVSPLFYQSLGFKKVDCMLPEYTVDQVQGFEWVAQDGE